MPGMRMRHPWSSLCRGFCGGCYCMESCHRLISQQQRRSHERHDSGRSKVPFSWGLHSSFPTLGQSAPTAPSILGQAAGSSVTGSRRHTWAVPNPVPHKQTEGGPVNSGAWVPQFSQPPSSLYPEIFLCISSNCLHKWCFPLKNWPWILFFTTIQWAIRWRKWKVMTSHPTV